MLRDTAAFTDTSIESATRSAHWDKRSGRSETSRRSVKIVAKSLSPGRTCRLGEDLLEQLHLRGIGYRSHLEAVSKLHRHRIIHIKCRPIRKSVSIWIPRLDEIGPVTRCLLRRVHPRPGGRQKSLFIAAECNSQVKKSCDSAYGRFTAFRADGRSLVAGCAHTSR